jgi:hypothetical protein
MSLTATFTRAFNGGVLAPDAVGRFDDPKYESGLAVCQNFIPLPRGPAQNRTGFEFVRAAKLSTKVRLIPFAFSVTQTMALEFGAGYLRFHSLGGTLESSPGVAYEIATPYVEADLATLKYTQNADVLTITHPNYAVYEVRRLALLNWTISPAVFATALVAPTGVAATATAPGPPANMQTYYYAVCAVDADSIDESLGAGTDRSITCVNNLFATGCYNTITWSAAPGAAYYNVYKFSSGVFGFIGQTEFLTFQDDNIGPNISKTPPLGVNPFTGAGEYPGAVTYYEQRRCFAGATNKPQNVWMTRAGTEYNMNYSVPARDDDAISMRLSSQKLNYIRHLVPVSNLIALTDSGVWRITSVNSDAITATSFSAKPQSAVGANDATPAVVDQNVIYASSRGGHLRELSYDWQASGYVTGDLSLRATHLFDNLEITDLAYAEAPIPIVWAVSSAGNLISLTYVPAQQVGAFATHTTDGQFESICVVSEGSEDILYAVVRRQINGAWVRYIERKREQLLPTSLADAFYVDCGDTYSGIPATTISGLGHLEGKTVNLLVDGAVHPQRVVTAGSITLQTPASKVQVGLPIVAQLETLPMAFGIPGAGQGRPKNVNRVTLRVYRSSGVFIGPSADNLREAKQRTTEVPGTPPALVSDELEVMVPASWGTGGKIVVRQDYPLPLTVVSLAADVSIGG